MKTIFSLLVIKTLLIVILSIGWVFNTVKFFKSDFESPYKTEVVRGIGIFIPVIGGVIGYCEIGEENSK